MRARGSRCWGFTLNNPTEEDVAQLHSVFKNLCADYRAQDEIAGTTGTPHIQGYVYFKDCKTRPSVSRLIPRACVYVARKPIALQTYCSKIATRAPGGRCWEPDRKPKIIDTLCHSNGRVFGHLVKNKWGEISFVAHRG